MAGVDLDGTLQSDDGFIELAQLAVGDAELVENLGVVGLALRHHLQQGHGLPYAPCLEHRQYELQRLRAGRQLDHLDVGVVNGDDGRLTGAAVLGHEVPDHGVDERLGADGTGVLRQQIQVEVLDGQRESEGLSAHGLKGIQRTNRKARTRRPTGR